MTQGNARRGPRLVFVLACGALLAAACGGSDDGSASGSGSGSTPAAGDGATDPGGSDSSGPDLGRVVALGEEFLLADLLALGVEPVASTATVADVGFQGLDGYDTSGITPLPSNERDIERLAALRPDTIITTSFFVDELGEDTLTAIGELIEVPQDLSPDEQVVWLGDALGEEDAAAVLVDEWEAAQAEAADALAGGDCTVSVATVYPGATVAAWIAAPNPVPVILDSVGCTLVPGPDEYDPDQAGRVYLSEEQITVLDAPVLVLLQSDTVEGEMGSLAAMGDSPLWARLPAVEAGQVREIDRLGYPGVEGQTRLVVELTEALSGAGAGSGGAAEAGS
jgi:iron complex transport system substrate-binding protein